MEEFTFVVELGEPGADTGPVGLVGGVVGVGGDVFEFEDLGVLRGFDPGDAGFEGCLVGVAGVSSPLAIRHSRCGSAVSDQGCAE